MEAELAALAVSGATTIVTLMVTDVWGQVRGPIARLFARGSEAQGVEEELECAREELTTAREAGDEDAAADVEEQWRLRLRRLLRSDPDAARELRRILEEEAPHAAPRVDVRNSIRDSTVNGPVFQGQTFSGLTFGSAPSGTSATGEGQR